jgi:hypothetical protein
MPLRDHFRPPVEDRHSWDELRGMYLYADLLELIGRSDPMLGAEPPALYAVTARGRKRVGKKPVLDTWLQPMAIGQPLPTLPIWLDGDQGVFLDLEISYEEACRVLRIISSPDSRVVGPLAQAVRVFGLRSH